MEKGNLENLFKDLQGSFDTEEPIEGHRLRFLEKLNRSDKVVFIGRKKNSWWKPLSIAASIAILCTMAISLYNTETTTEKQLAKILPEVTKTEFYFANLIEEQVQQLESESTPETKKIIDDTIVQLNKLEDNYNKLQQEILNGGDSKLILSAMITNFQTRIDLLQNVLNQIDNIKTLKNFNNEIDNNTV